MSLIYEKIYETVSKVPYGKVATYGQIAELTAIPGKARLVGYALYRLTSTDTTIPWHRIVNAKGCISYDPTRFGNDHLQRDKLEQEGIIFDPKGKINLRKYLWCPE